MPPEYINHQYVSSKFDVFSLGVIIIKMLAGKKAYYSPDEMPPEQFIKFVREIIIVFILCFSFSERMSSFVTLFANFAGS